MAPRGRGRVKVTEQMDRFRLAEYLAATHPRFGGSTAAALAWMNAVSGPTPPQPSPASPKERNDGK
jgi:hypothetical protein